VVLRFEWHEKGFTTEVTETTEKRTSAGAGIDHASSVVDPQFFLPLSSVISVPSVVKSALGCGSAVLRKSPSQLICSFIADE
jgi:hypothetical protein